MPYLNWSTETLEVQRGDHDIKDHFIELRAHSTLLAQLAETFQEGLNAPSPNWELRVDLPRKWTLFFKRHDYMNRILVAHPEPEIWVSTFILTSESYQTLAQRLSQLEKTQECVLGQFLVVDPVSNLEFAFRLQS